jgi:hypothetical protein
LERQPTGAQYLSRRLFTRTWSVTWINYRQMAGWIPNFSTTGFPPPAFLLQKNKMRMPKMNSLMSKQDVKFIDYYERLISVSSLNWLMRTGTGLTQSLMITL